MEEQNREKTPKNKRRRKNKKYKPSHKATPQKLDFEYNDYSDYEYIEESPSPKMATENQPTNQQKMDILNELTQSQREVQDSQQFISEKIDKFEERMTQLAVDNEATKQDIANLQLVDQTQQKHLDSLAYQVEEIEQRSINNDLVISGTPNLQNITIDIILQKLSEV